MPGRRTPLLRVPEQDPPHGHRVDDAARFEGCTGESSVDPAVVECRRPAMRTCSLVCLIGLAGAGCAPVGSYLRDRGMDASDIVDLKYGAGLNYGLGAKVEPVPFTGVGLGFGSPCDVTEWFGRRAWQMSHLNFIHIGFFGIESQGLHNGNEPCFFGVQLPLYGDRVVELVDVREAFRAGGEVILPFVRGGLYVNLFEIADFLAGWFGLDVAGDDGQPKAVND